MAQPTTPSASPTAVQPTEVRPSLSPTADALRRLRRNPIAIACAVYIVLLLLLALFAPLIAPFRYDALDTRALLAPPGGRHLLGTDNLGQDVFSRLLYGARISVSVALVVILIESVVGITLGLIAGYRGGTTDLLLMRFTEVMFAFPDVLLAILLVSILTSGAGAVASWARLGALFFALAITAWPGMARLVRGQALALRQKEFVEAARAVGVGERAILFRHLLPNMAGPLLVQMTQDVAAVMLAEATLSFLGLGVPPPYPSWGRMIFDAITYMRTQPLLLISPGLALALTVMAFNFLGDALRDAFDPRLR